MKRIAIMGTGSLGTILGAFISLHRQVDLIDVNEAHVKALNEHGAKITGTMEFTVPVKAFLPEELTDEYDLIIFLVKQVYNDSAIASIKNHINENTIILTLQNGFPEPALIEVFGENRVIGCTVGWGATWIEPGVSELTTPESALSFSMGRLNGEVDQKVLDCKTILENMCEVHLEDNFAGMRWAKLLVNATYSGLSAALGCTFGDVLDDPIASVYAMYVCNECIRVGDAWGVTKYPTAQGENMRDTLGFKDNQERLLKANTYETGFRPAQLLKASMLQDLEKGRPTEIHAINGIVTFFGKKEKIATPFNDEIIRIVTTAEANKTVPTMENLPALEKVLAKYRY